VPQPGRNPRKLTPKECARLQGFPDKFIPSNSDNQAYRQFGNSVAIPVVKRVAEEIMKKLERSK
jgi:DNA (cytosine-5)-methyltransferase 1